MFNVDSHQMKSQCFHVLQTIVQTYCLYFYYVICITLSNAGAYEYKGNVNVYDLLMFTDAVCCIYILILNERL